MRALRLLAGALLAAGATGCGAERPCDGAEDCRSSSCTEAACVDGECVFTDREDGAPPLGDPYEPELDCTRWVCRAGEQVTELDPSDLEADVDPTDCEVPACVESTAGIFAAIVDVVDGAPCRFAWGVEGTCREGACTIPVPTACVDFCALCPEGTSTAAAGCQQRCAADLLGPCGGAIGEYRACLVAAGDCVDAGGLCATERAAMSAACDGCSTSMGTDCGFEQRACAGHAYETRCPPYDPTRPPQPCECLVDGEVVDTCFNPDVHCSGACCFAHTR